MVCFNMHGVTLSLGSNRGDSRKILKGAIQEIGLFLSNMKISSLYKTAPQDYINQDDFYNMVVMGKYEKTPEELLRTIQSIEKKYGRNRPTEIPKGPRFLDIDILFFGTLVLTTPELTIPHPAISNRQFVLVPLLEISPQYADPIRGECYTLRLAELPDQGVQNIGLLT